MTEADSRVRLKEVLLAELILYTRLLGVEERKKEAMVLFDQVQLQAAVREEAEITGQLHRLEARRIDVTNRLGRELQLDIRACGLEEIAEAMTDPWKSELLDLRARLKEVSVDIRSQNDLNRMLSTQSLQHIRETLSILAYTGKGSGTYSSTGPSTDRTVVRQLIDQRA